MTDPIKPSGGGWRLVVDAPITPDYAVWMPWRHVYLDGKVIGDPATPTRLEVSPELRVMPKELRVVRQRDGREARLDRSRGPWAVRTIDATDAAMPRAVEGLVAVLNGGTPVETGVSTGCSRLGGDRVGLAGRTTSSVGIGTRR